MTEFSNPILIVGADRVMPKLFYFAHCWARHDAGFTVYSHDIGEDAQNHAARFGARIEPSPPHSRSLFRLLKDFAWLFSALRRTRYRHAELYCDYHMLASLGYLVILRMFRVPVVVWFRGELYDWPVFRWWQRGFVRLAVKLGSVVVLKEAYMAATLKDAGIEAEGKTVHLHNTIPLPDARPKAFDGPSLDLVFVNMFKSWRNVPFCVDIAVALRQRAVPFTLRIVGDKPDEPALDDVAQTVRAAIARHDLGAQVWVEPFTTSPQAIFGPGELFILPADLIYCNYALLEAMGHGLVPLVFDQDQDYRQIVEDEDSGFGLPLDADRWAATIAALHEDRAKARKMSVAARQRIIDKFTVDAMFDRYAGLVMPLWRRGGEDRRIDLSTSMERT